MSPANIDATLGRPAFVFNSQNGDPWHRVGTAVDHAMTWDEVLERCPEVAFAVAMMPVNTVITTPDGPLTVPLNEWRAIVRTDTNSPLGLVSPGYTLYQTEALGRFADAVRGSSGANYDTAGSLFGGRMVFTQLDLGDTFKVPGDDSPWVRRLLISTGHDGRHALKAKRTQTRVVCSNTLSAALGEVSPEYVVRHTSQMDVQVDEARKALQMAENYDEAFEVRMADLTRTKMTLNDVIAFTEVLIPIAPADMEKSVRKQADRDAIASLFSKSPTLDGVPLTAYRTLQAVAEWTDHYRLYRKNGFAADEVLAESIVDGSAAKIKAKALALLS